MPLDVEAIVVSNTRLSEEYNVVALDAPTIAARVRPGQFVMVKPGRPHDPLLRRPFSVFDVLRDAAGTPQGISLLNKRIGVGTRLLFDAKPGDRLPCLGPLGRPFDPVEPPVRAWMVAGGVGLAPFVTLAEALRRNGTETTLFYGARTAADLHGVDRFERMGVAVRVATEDGSQGDHGFVTVPLGAALTARGATRPVCVYACGPTAMMRAVASLAVRHACDIHVSLEQVMGCGLGGCYSCVVRVAADGERPHFVRSCLGGPVFDGRAIDWDSLSH